jgi:hypothetical protein
MEIGDDEARCYYQEPNADVTIDDGTLHVRVERFEQQSGTRQTIDNAKHLYVARETIPLAAGDVIELVAQMGAEVLGTDSGDYRDGFAAFNVVDEDAQLVYDTITTGCRVYAVHECLAPGKSFTWITDSPLKSISVKPGAMHEYRISIDTRGGGRASYAVDGVEFFELDRLRAIPRSLRIAIGLFTLHPIVDGRSTSLRNQGMYGLWKDVRYRILSA